MEYKLYDVDVKSKIIAFANRAQNIYIYGAGTFARRYYDFFMDNNIKVSGFVVSRKNKEEFLGLCVYSVDELDKLLQSNDAIIPAFENSNAMEIKRLFSMDIDVLEVDHLSLLLYITKKRFHPVLQDLINRYGKGIDISNKSEIRKILVIRTDAIGDLICTIPFIRELRYNYLDARITVIIRGSNKLILNNCEYIDELWTYDSDMIDGEIYEQLDHIDKVRKQVKNFADNHFKSQFDMVFLPRELMAGRNIFDDLLLALESGAKVRIAHVVNSDIRKQYVYDTMKDLFTKIVYSSEAKHEVEYQLDMLIETGHTVADNKMELWITDEMQLNVMNRFSELKISQCDYLIAIGLVASVPTRTWSIENYIELFEKAANLYGTHVKFLIMGGNDAAIEYDKVNVDMSNVINFTGKTSLEETIAIIKNCNLYIGSNTGLLHIASASGIPSITIYAELDDGIPTDGDHPVKMGAWGVKHVNLIPPSGLDGCHRVCRMGYSHCINQIRPEMIFEEMQKYINIK